MVQRCATAAAIACYQRKRMHRELQVVGGVPPVVLFDCLIDSRIAIVNMPPISLSDVRTSIGGDVFDALAASANGTILRLTAWNTTVAHAYFAALKFDRNMILVPIRIGAPSWRKLRS
jgi:hypothetical protein